jgi:hypothetical protein
VRLNKSDRLVAGSLANCVVQRKKEIDVLPKRQVAYGGCLLGAETPPARTLRYGPVNSWKQSFRSQANYACNRCDRFHKSLI